MRRLLILALLPLAGCANPYDTSHLSDEERAAALGALLGRPAPQPYYIPPNAVSQPTYNQAPAVQQNKQTYCQWQTIGNMRHYQCF